MLALTWRDIDLQKGVITVSKPCHDSWQNGEYVKMIDSNCINNIDIKVDGLSSIVGGIVGYAEGGRIEKCENKGEIAAIGYWDGWPLS